MTVCKYELHFGVDISIFRVCPVEVSTGLCDIMVSNDQKFKRIFANQKARWLLQLWTLWCFCCMHTIVCMYVVKIFNFLHCEAQANGQARIGG